MATLAPHPGPAVIQRANSLQASDTSHTSTASSTSADASTNTSVSHAKPSPMSSIGESISSVVYKSPIPIPPARTIRPLPIPPTVSAPTSPGLTSTSTLKLSHQESHSTLGKSSQANYQKPASASTLPLTKSKNTPTRKLSRTRLGSDTDAPPAPQPPPSAFNPRRMSDDGWVSVSIMPVLSERSPDGTDDSISCVLLTSVMVPSPSGFDNLLAGVWGPPEERLRDPSTAPYTKPTAASSGKRSASAGSTKSTSKAPAPTPVTTKSKPHTTSKSLPRLPRSEPPPLQQPPQPQDGAWKLEFRGVVRLVRWVSRRDKAGDKRGPAVEGANENRRPDHRPPEDEKFVVEEPVPQLRKGFSISNETRRSRDSYTQPIPRPNAPIGGIGPVRARPLSIVQPRPKLEGENEGNEKRRLTKSNPGLVNFALCSSGADRTSTEIAQRARTSTGTGVRTSADVTRRTSSDIGLGLGISPNGGGVFMPDVPLAIPAAGSYPPRSSSLVAATSILPTSGANAAPSAQPEPRSSLDPHERFGEGDDTITFLPPVSFSSLPYRHGPISPAQQVTTVTQTTTTQTTTTQTTFQTSPLSITQAHSALATTTHTHALGTTHVALAPVLEVPLFTSELVTSPPELGTETSEFPWNGTRRSVVRVGEIVPSGSVIFKGGAEVAAAAQVNAMQATARDNATQVDTVVTEVVGSVPIAAVEALANSLSSTAASSASPLSSGSLSPLPSTSVSVSPFMSNVASSSTSPIMTSNAHLSDPYVTSQAPATAASSLSYRTARSNRNSLPAAQAIFDQTTAGLQMVVDPPTSEQFGPSNDSYVLRASAATDVSHDSSSRAISPTPSDRYAFSDDPHEQPLGGGILRTLSSIDHSDSPLPVPRRPFMPTRGSSGSVTFDDSSAQSSPRLGNRRKMMTMSASDVGHGDRFSAVLAGNHYAYTRSPRPTVQRSKSSLSIAGRLIRKLSIGSSSHVVVTNGIENESEQKPRVTRKLTRRKAHSRTASMSTASLPYTGDGSGVPPVPPLPPGVASARVNGRAQSEVGHGIRSDIGHGGSEISHGYGRSDLGHSRGDSMGSMWDASTSVLGHESTTSHATTLVSPVPGRYGIHSAPAASGARNKLVKKHRQAPRLATGAVVPGRSLASLDFPNEPISREAPRITTEFVQPSLSLDGDSSATVLGSGDGHLMPPRPGMPRRTSSQRRWTIADIDDDEFLRQLEVKLSGSGSRLRKSRVLEEFAMGADQGHEDTAVDAEADPGSGTDDSAAEREWAKARRAMMCVREIVRTEKSYLRHIVGFLDGDQSAMSSILLEHLPRLVETSRIFAAHLEEDPSAWGVSVAFLAVEKQLEHALVEWSGVVGQVISSMRNGGESQAASEDGHMSSVGTGSGASSWIRRRSATASSSNSQPFQLNLSMTPVIGSKDKKSTRPAKSKRLTEQDVAIMPTQRVLRYVLMYRELLLHTPVKSASRPLVERALHGATRIARRCDEAQTHVDMLSPS
ncbi:hypothetical protein FRC06_003248 [Ceratobasidium sp. 370]|nr:hypothetical protein FRC06_003248 [Ceratobasidium sp. 370]